MPTKIGPCHWRIDGRGLLAERGVGLVADHDRVRVGDLARVAHEPLVGLDGDRPLGRGVLVLAGEQRALHALLVAAVGQLAVELVDEVAAVGEDQHAAGARGLDEAERGDGLAGAGGVLEPEAARGSGVVLQGVGGGLLLGLLGLVPVERLLLVGELLVALDLDLAGGQLLDLAGAARPLPLPLARRACDLGGERDQRARQRVDLVGGERGAVGELGLLVGEQALEPEDQRVLAPPLDRRLLAAGVELGQRGVERAAAGRARRERGAASSPSSTNGSRANSSARRRSSPDTGAESAREVLSAMGPSVLGEGRGTGLPSASGLRGPSRTQRVRLRRAAHACPASGAGARRIQSAASARITAHERDQSVCHA